MKRYSLLQEMNWAKHAHNLIGSVAQANTTRGVLAGATIGGIKGGYDANQQGRSVLGGVAKGTLLGGAAGGVVGSGLKHLARTDMAKDAQRELQRKAIQFHKDKAGMQAIKDLGEKAIGKNGKYTDAARRAYEKAHDEAKLLKQATGFGGNSKLFSNDAAGREAAADWAARDTLLRPIRGAYKLGKGAWDGTKAFVGAGIKGPETIG